MFTIGQLVECVDVTNATPRASFTLRVGDIYVVRWVVLPPTRKPPRMRVADEDGNSWTFYARRFRVVEEL